MKLNLQRGQLITIIKAIVSLNIIFLAGTFLFHKYFYKILDQNWESGTNKKYLLVEFSLATENVLAVWYSSMLIFSVAIVFFLIFLFQQKKFSERMNKFKAYGWLLISGIFVLLSLDEMASLHERLGNIDVLNPLSDYASGWVALLAIPIALVAGFIIWFCLSQMRRAPLAAVCAVAGILLFVSIPIQEYYEMQAWEAVDYVDTWQRPVAFLLLEEGCELFGTTLILASGLLFLYSGTKAGKHRRALSSLELKLQLNNKKTVLQYSAWSIFLALLMLIIVKSDVLVMEGDNGIRENWFPSATAFFSSLLCLYLYLRPKSSHPNLQKIILYLGVFCLLISAYYGANLYSYIYNPTNSYSKMFVVALLALTTSAFAIKLLTQFKDPYKKAAVVLWACFLIYAFVIFNWYSAALTYIGFTFLSITFLHQITLKIPVNSSSPVTGKKAI